MAPPDLVLHPRGARSMSISSDRQTPSSTGYGGLLSPPTLITPDPAFIAASAASQIVTNDHDSQADTWLDQHGIEPSGETALVAQPALRLVNRFLDQLLFNFLSIAKSTSLSSLRPAVSEVLKPKLARDAINGADQELHEYLGGGDDETIMAYHNGLEADGNWDLELIWKRTRLRCMVYSSLGDMEEEDEDFYTEREHLDPAGAIPSQFLPSSGVVSPAVAIFLTSILEFIGEQVLIVAGQAAYQRLKLKYEKEAKDGTNTTADIADRVVVEDTDMERVALDRTLGRLWRGWKKRVRSPTSSISMTRSFSRESLNAHLQHSRAASIAPDETIEEDANRPAFSESLAELELALVIPLPMSDNDIREIEIPGLAPQSDDFEVDPSSSDEEPAQPRPRSLIFFGNVPLTHTSLRSGIAPLSSYRKRASSLPTPESLPYTPSKRAKFSDEDLGKDAMEKSREDEAVNGSTIESESEAQEQNAESGDSRDLVAEVAEVVASVAAVGAIAGASIVALVKGEAPQTELDTKSEVDPEEESFIEEPEEEVQILTSSRVSIGGGCISPDDLKGLSRRSSVRSQSNHSVRVIEVSRPASTQPVPEVQPQRIASPISRTASASPHSRNAPASLHTRHSAGESIMEEKEVYESDNEIMTAVPADLAAAMQGVDVDPSPTSQHFYSNEASRANTPKPAPVILAAAPPSRHPKHTAKARSPTRDYQTNGRLAGGTKSPINENGTSPTLTPLREITEGAADFSDKASSLSHGYEGQPAERQVNDHSSSVSVSTQRQVPLRSINTNVSRDSSPRTRDEGIRKVSTRRSNGSGSDTASQKYVAHRASEESSSAGGKGQSFEQLIRSDQTIQYTLTPETMRNIEAIDSPNGSSSIKANTFNVPRPISVRSRSSSAGRFNALRANPPDASAANPGFQPVTRSVTGGSRLRSNLPQARDARVDRDSIGDFAEFIRSTGPANSYDQTPPPAAQKHRGTDGTARNFSGSVPRNDNQASLPRRAASTAGRNKLQARDAVVPRGDSISDLIDFVRSGPQVEAGSGHRISRTVAPFRTTMDSDQMVGAVGGKAVNASFQDARYSAASNSVVSSATSSTGLLKHAAISKPAPGQRPDFDEEDRMPKRKTRRVRDPYAIDLSDEDDEYMPAPRAKPIQEESLADFLRNVPPPPESTTTSVFDSVPKPNNKDIKKKASTPSLMSRFARKDSNTLPVPNPKASPGQSSRIASRQGSVAQPITATYNTITSTPREKSHGNDYASQTESARNRIPRKAYQPRDPLLSSTNRTNDLADFLMRSEPPSGAQAQPQTFTPTLQKEESSAFQRMFGRKKVH